MADSNSWLDDALRNLKPIERNPQGIASGQIRTVGFSNSDFSRMCVVLEVHSATNYCEVMLIHHEEEMATDVDLVISSDESDHFHTMVIQTDCHSVVFLLQLGEHVDNLTPEEMEELKDITLNQKFIKGNGNEKLIDNFQKIYKEDLIKKNKINKKIKAVVACGNGTAGIFAPEILRGIGCEVIELDCDLDFNFPKYNPNPEDLEMLHAISKAVKDNNADIGFGFDGDGDRVGVIDNNGNEIFSDKIGLLIARNLSKNHQGSKFVVDVKSTGLYAKDEILLKNNCETLYWKTGHSHIKRKVNLEKALAGFEKSGHFFFNKPLGFGYDDGVSSAIQVCHLLNNSDKNLSEIISELPKTFQSPTMAPYCKDNEKYKVVEDLVNTIQETKKNKTKIDGQEINEIITVNGVRFSFIDGSWGLIRASSNKPSLVVVTESTTSDDRKKKIFDFIDGLLQKTGKIGEYDQKI